ncbi:MAG: hypothetical protein LUD17_06225 [Bacteroidales bacterium]|nr:hypothetical protein [Bacteroidales bacterium]
MKPTIGELLGFALGRMGMSLADFRRLTPSDFEEAAKAYLEGQSLKERGAWERARMVAMYAAQPHCRKRVTIPLPWDKNRPQGEEKRGREARAEAERRFRELTWQKPKD